jgi:CBS domain-containing protein|tara:strand:- start:8278 stop:8724 length:447 start_codon:yes stop_codon:yes gene_type:complete
MSTVEDILSRKPRAVHEVDANAAVLEAAKVMNDHKIGSVVVKHGGRMVGILTERDILTRIVAKQRDPSATKASEVMTRSVLTCRPATKLNEARKVMREKHIRHLPVVDEDRVVGMVSIGDLNHAEHDILVETIHSMETYIAGGTASLI